MPDALGGVDVLWHLGAQVWRGTDQIAVNVDGTANVLAAHPGHLVLASSAAVYGAHPDNPLPITEDQPPRPNAECPYAWHKLEAERLAEGAAIVRLGAVLGPHADARVARAARGYRLAVPAYRGVPQAVQFLDEDDAAAGLLAAGFAGVAGTWNIATDDWLDAGGIAAIAGSRVIRVPRELGVRAAELGFRLRALPFGADRACLVDGPLALDPARARAELGWKPRRNSAEVLAAQLGRR